ncbi:MAG: DUF411 domain-containing protein [Burkholderiales bacterium]|nr:DUF411 domain-containing protein [Burkholderiales bacterium]
MTSQPGACTIGRRRLLLGLVALPIARVGDAHSRPVVEVWKAPTCGCCKDWIAHMEANGFPVKAHDTGNNGVRLKLGMPAKLGSCHTAVVGGYVIEGHVPAREILRLLKGKPVALGLTVPGMPVGSPGMDGPVYGGRVDPYDVLLVRRNGVAVVFQSYR